jgi:hypothetical protein
VNKLVIATGHGSVYVVGRIWPDPGRPALLAVSGAWPPTDFLHELVDWFPQITVLVAPIPGMDSTPTSDFDLARVSRAFDAAIAKLLPGCPIVALGASAGALVTLNLQSSGVVRHVVHEPFFRTAPLWPVADSIRREPEKYFGHPGNALAAWEIFGVSAQESADRDYRSTLETLNCPVDVILADLPLEPTRQIVGWPSLTSAEDRARLAAHPLVTVHNGPAGSGHVLLATSEGLKQIRDLLHTRLEPIFAEWLAAQQPATSVGS